MNNLAEIALKTFATDALGLAFNTHANSTIHALTRAIKNLSSKNFNIRAHMHDTPGGFPHHRKRTAIASEVAWKFKLLGLHIISASPACKLSIRG